MKKVILILKHEFVSVVTRPSFLITLFLLPVVGFVVMLVAGAVTQGQSGNPVASIFANSSSIAPQGFIDHSGLIRETPVSQTGLLIQMEDERQGQAGVLEGRIDSYYIIPADYLDTGELTLVQQEFNLYKGDQGGNQLQELLAFNLFGKNEVLFERFNSPMKLTVEYLSGLAERSQGDPGQFMVPYLVMILLYVIIITSASLLLTSITSEKQNRVMEILLTSTTPLEMLTGKIIALGLVGLLQMLAWFGSGFILLSLAGRQFSLGPSFELPPAILFWGFVFFILGYALYGSLMAGLGALVPNLREGNQAVILVIFPLIIPMLFSSSVSAAPNNPLFLSLSLIPFTSPITMLSRLAATDVPLWQLLLAAGILVATNLVILHSVARLFKTQTLLSGNSFRAKDFFKALINWL